MFTTPLTMKSDEKRIMFMEEMRPKNLSLLEAVVYIVIATPRRVWMIRPIRIISVGVQISVLLYDNRSSYVILSMFFS